MNAMSVNRVSERGSRAKPSSLLTPTWSRGWTPLNSAPGESARLATSPLATNPERGAYLAMKRALDMTAAAVLLAAVSPVLLFLCLVIKLTSPGPVVFRQTRCGIGGRHFTCYKFRTMCKGAEALMDDLADLNEVSGPVFKLRHDPRVTRVGHFLRKSSLDELPQLFNVLRGDMTLVGPRPPVPEEVAMYTAHDFGRLAVKPGMTCLWQVSGRSDIGFAEWVELDLEYIRKRGFWYDAWIMLRTIPAVVSGRGAV